MAAIAFYVGRVFTSGSVQTRKEGVEDAPTGVEPKRERQYEHIKDAEKGGGLPEPTAKEIAAYASGGVTTWLGTD